MLRQYRVDKVLGQGGFGITYLAYDTELERDVAIKECFPRDFVAREGTTIVPTSSNNQIDYDWALEKFIAEATTLAKFRHPGIVQVLQILKGENNSAYMVLEFIDGQSLDQWLKSLPGPPKQAQLEVIIEPLLDALTAVHRAKFAHRDIAPDNIYIRKSGEAVLLDFGAAKLLAAQHSKTMNLVVKDGYSAPEQYYAEGRQGPWTDIYAFSATVYRCLSGQKPIDAMARLDAKNNGEPDPLKPCSDLGLSDYSAEFLNAVDAGLSPQAKSRPQDISSWRKLLLPNGGEEATSRPQQPLEFAEDAPPPVAQEAPDKGTGSKRKSKTGLLAAGLMATLLIGGGVSYWLYEQQKIAAEARAWTLAETADSEEGYKSFIASHPESTSKGKAEEALQALTSPWEITLDETPGTALTLETTPDAILIAGFTTLSGEKQKQASLSKISLSGKIRWSAEFGEDGDQTFQDVAQLPNQDVVAAGFSINPSQGTKQALIAQYSSTGDLKWSRSIGGPGDDELFAVTVLTNGNIAAAGTTSKIKGGIALAWLLELSDKGELIRQRTFDTPEGGAFHAIQETPGGGFFLAGNTHHSKPDAAKFWMKKLSSGGGDLLNRTFGRTHDKFNAIAPGQNGDFLIVGETQSFGTNTVDGIVVRLSADNKMQPKPFLDEGDDSLTGITVAPNGTFYTVGHTTSRGNGNVQAWLLEISQDLQNVTRNETFEGQGFTTATDVGLLKDNSIVIVGATRSAETASSAPWIKRIKAPE